MQNFKAYLKALFSESKKEIYFSLALTGIVSLTEGMTALLLIPLLAIAGIPAQASAAGKIELFFRALFSGVHLKPTLAGVLLLFGVLMAVRAALVRCQSLWRFRLERSLTDLFRVRIYEALMRAEWLYVARKKGSDLLQALTVETQNLEDATFFLSSFVTSLGIAAVYLFFCVKISWAFTVFSVLCGGSMLFLIRRHSKESREAGEGISEASKFFYELILSHLGRFKMAKSYSMEKNEMESFRTAVQTISQRRARFFNSMQNIRFFFDGASAVILVALFYFIYRVLKMPISEILILLFFFARLLPQLTSAYQNFQEFLEALPSFSRLRKIEEEAAAHAEVSVGSDRKTFPVTRQVRLEDIHFGYSVSGQTPILRGADLMISSGTIVVLSGASGSGKSTLADILTGLLKPQKGSIFVDDVRLSNQDISGWRGSVGYVGQDTFLFNDTLLANLLWANPAANSEEIFEALQLSSAESLAKTLPQGLQTPIGDRGICLSAGERQRIALARALLRKPSLLVLDEATNQLDAENENHILETVKSLKRRLPVLMISHQEEVARISDFHYLLKDGQLKQL